MEFFKAIDKKIDSDVLEDEWIFLNKIKCTEKTCPPEFNLFNKIEDNYLDMFYLLFE